MSASIQSREDLSFTQWDGEGRFISWPQNNPGVAADWEKGMAFFDAEICSLAEHDETEAYNAIRFAIIDLAARSTCLEIGFADSVARAAVLGLRAMRSGAERFEPKDFDGE